MVQVYPEWQKVAYIRLTNPPTVNDYPVRVELDYLFGMQADFADIRFTDVYGRILSYNILEYTSGTSATVDVKVENQDSAIMLYYANPLADDASDGDNVYDFWDGFDSSLDSSKWTTVEGAISTSGGNLELVSTTGTRGKISHSIAVTAPIIAECRMKWSGNQPKFAHFLVLETDTNNYVDAFFGATNLLTVTNKSAGSPVGVTGGTVTEDMWARYKFVWTSASTKLYQDSTLKCTNSSYVPTTTTTNLYIREGDVETTTVYLDWVLVRKFLTTEPTTEVVITKPNPYYGISFIPDTLPRFIPEQLGLNPIGGLY